jgi:hypothetical protein
MKAGQNFPAEHETLLPEEIVEITGCRRKARQLEWLRNNGWIHYTSGSGDPVVGRQYARMMLAGLTPNRQMATGGWKLDYTKIR